MSISDTIERECLSVLHKLHDQVNGLQLVQVVVQPLARLFNPASLATLAAADLSQSQSPSSMSGGPIQCNDLDGGSSSSAAYNHHSRSQSFASSFGVNSASNMINTPMSINNNNTSLPPSSTSTYMMSPDTAQALIARLDTDRDVNWLMEIIGYGLSMPFSLTGEQDSVKDCCTIYCEWLASSLLPYNKNFDDSKYQQLSKLVPVPIRKDPNRYARKILSHLYNVFLQRQLPNPPATNSSSSLKEQTDIAMTAVSRQAVLCHRVLRTIESIAHNQSNLMDNDTWNHLLALLLTVNDKLLSPPTEPDDIGTQLHDRILGVLYDLMLLACARLIPDANLWKTFSEMSLNWRHRPASVDHWRRITLMLTKRIILMAPANQKPTSEQRAIETSEQDMGPQQSQSQILRAYIATMSHENLSQTWYRFLNLIGNPVELSDPAIISRTDEFYHAACLANNVLDPRQHPCLNVLPKIFLNSMSGLREFVESFIGAHEYRNIAARRSSQEGPLQQQVCLFKLNPSRPKCNSILHIFGDWLFSAALIGSDLNQEMDSEYLNDGAESCNASESMTSAGSSSVTTEVGPPSNYSPAFRRRQSHQSTSSQASTPTSRIRSFKPQDFTEKITLDPPLTADSFESGQAEAMDLLCKIFSSKSSSEDISSTYLARFYLCLQHCLVYGCGQDPKQSKQAGLIKRQLLASVLINATALLQKDLDGINLLIPCFIKAIEFVFECNERDAPIQPPPRQNARAGSIRSNTASTTSAQPGNLNNVTNHDLRRACIMTLINILAYPFHFQELAIRSCLDNTSPTTTFGSLRPKLLRILFVALQTETDAANMQILFGGLSLAIHDLTFNTKKLSNSGRGDGANKRQNNEGQLNNRSDHGQTSPDASHNDHQQADDTISQSSFVFDSNEGFLIKSLHVICHLLINVWKHDNLVSLAALDVLTLIARVSTDTQRSSFKTSSNNNSIEMTSEYAQTTKWICDYICNQCSRPPPAHSKDMHSTIVAAYQCLSVWFYNHPHLLNDKNCVNTLMEVIELGVSGQKSKSMSINPTIGVATQTTISKGEKLMKPSSMRVREAAESLLNICMVRTCSAGQKNIALYDTVLNEHDIADLFSGLQYKASVRQIQDSQQRQLEAYKLFRYFSDEDSIVFGLYECLDSDPNSRDSVICLMRTPFGKHCWKMKFNYYSDKSREKIIANKALGLIKRQPLHCATPIAENRIFAFTKGHKSLYFNNTAKYFPETIENLPQNPLDQLVATLDDYVAGNLVRDARLKFDLDKMSKVFSHQVSAEQKVISECSVRIKRVDSSCEEPKQTNDLDTARIIVNHLGLKTALSSLSSGEKVSEAFVNQLKALDNQSVRVCDSVNIFYVRKGRTTTDEILESVRERHSVTLEFFEWLVELGQPVVAREHNRWNGQNPKPQADASPPHEMGHLRARNEQGLSIGRNEMLSSDNGGAIFDGDRMLLYWSDMCQELAFLVPHRPEKVDSNTVIFWLESADDMSAVSLINLDVVGSSSSQTGASGLGGHGGDTPTSGHRGKSPCDYAKYFISPMRNGLFRINVMTSLGRQWLALPLVDGMTVSRVMLGSFIRESVLNLCRRRRLDADNYQPPHVKRRLKIQDICSNYKISSRYESGEFYYNLFRSRVAATSSQVA